MKANAATTSLGEALDNTNLTWLTSTNYPWFGTNDSTTYDGVDGALSGNRYVANTTSWLQTTVAGPGTLSFWWNVSSDLSDFLEFDLDGVQQETILGTDGDWSYRSYSIPSGAHTARWQYVKDGQFNFGDDRGWVDRVSYSTNPPMPLQQALDTCGVVWTTGGNTNPTYWIGQTNMTHDGKAAAQSGAIYNNQESWLQAVVRGVTNVGFWWKVSSEANYDWLEFYTNNNLAIRISGEVGWQSNFFRLPAATNTLEWRYVKNDFDLFGKGEDRAWLDQITLSPPGRAAPYALRSPTRLGDGRFQLIVAGDSGCPCRLEFSTNLPNWYTLTNLTTSGTNTQVIDSSASQSPLRLYRAISP